MFSFHPSRAPLAEFAASLHELKKSILVSWWDSALDFTMFKTAHWLKEFKRRKYSLLCLNLCFKCCHWNKPRGLSLLTYLIISVFYPELIWVDIEIWSFDEDEHSKPNSYLHRMYWDVTKFWPLLLFIKISELKVQIKSVSSQLVNWDLNLTSSYI